MTTPAANGAAFANASSLTDTNYANVVYKKQEGSLVLSDVQLSFHSTAKQAKEFGLPWTSVTKHQVSPASHPKALLKVIAQEVAASAAKSFTFLFKTRSELDRIRRDVTARLKRAAAASSSLEITAGTKRPYSAIDSAKPPSNNNNIKTNGDKTASADFDMDCSAIAVTRSALLSANPTLRDQHDLLVRQTKTLTEEDFWNTHRDNLEQEYAKICGKTKAGTSSLIRSNLELKGKVTLGVEEMRQIFILYPAVHKAYEAKVPLELSEEQFWRKYLESEYFYRDRGRLGLEKKNDDGVRITGSADDLFSRLDTELKEKAQRKKKFAGKIKLAVGQFDLAATAQTERGHLVIDGARDYHPAPSEANQGQRVIEKYNRHWAMVLHPETATAGCDLMEVAQQSVEKDVEKISPAIATHKEMERLVGFASVDESLADHVHGRGIQSENEEDALFQELVLRNVEAYSGQMNQSTEVQTVESLKRRAVFAQALATKVGAMTSINGSGDESTGQCFPKPELGRDLLAALTKKMLADAQTEADALELVNQLPQDFKDRLLEYFRRSSELLRHFFGLRRVLVQPADTAKLARIVQAMEGVYREMEGMRKDFPQTETGEVMRKMCVPIMDQLDWAFQLHRDGSGGGGGFVTVEEL